MKTRNQAMIDELKRNLVSYPLLRYNIKKKILRKLPLRFLYRLGILFNPYDVGFCLSGKCNLKCKMCDLGLSKDKKLRLDSVKMVEKDNILGIKENKEIIDKISKFQPIVRLIGAGEPLIYKDVIPFVKYLKEKGLATIIVTNGTNLERFSDKLFKLSVYSINVSIDGPENVHDQIRGVKGSYTNAINGLRKLAELKRVNKSLFPQLRVNCTISNFNFNYIDKFVDDMIHEDIDILNFFHLFFKTKESVSSHNSEVSEEFRTTPSSIFRVKHHKIEPKILQDKINYLQEKYNKFNITFQPKIFDDKLINYYTRPHKAIARKRCIIPWTKMYILPDGGITPMYMCINYPLGNIQKDTLKDVWRGHKFSQFRQELIKRRSFKICSRCCGSFSE